jgi:dTDP-4-dehydrorhamnose 3,5-epimerase
MIDGVKVKHLKVNCDERGNLFEILRSDDDLYLKFGQAYVTTSYPGVVKAWHMHKHQSDHMSVITGRVKFVLYDARENSPTYGEINELFFGDQNRMLVQIPPGIYHGFKNIGVDECHVLNLPTEVYKHTDPDEFRLDPLDKKIPYNWARQDG